jgi:transcriptional regulator with XRE-family HTH domain
MISKSLERSIARVFLVELRCKVGLTQRQFAARSWIAKLEAGDRYLRLSDLEPIARALKISRYEVVRLSGLQSKKLTGNRSTIPRNRPVKLLETHTSAWLALLTSYRKRGSS